MIAILKDTSIYAIGDVLAKGIGFLAIVFYAHFISQSDMGAYGYILIILGFANTFLILGADNAYARYFFKYKSEHKKKILTTTLFVFLFIWMVAVLVLPIAYSKELSYLLLDSYEYALAFFFALISLPLKLLSSMSNQALRNQFKTKEFVLFNFITAVVTVMSAILLLQFTKMGVASIFVGMIVGDVVVLPFRLFAIKELFVKEVNFGILKRILVYGIPFLPASVAYWVFSSADRVMLEAMSTLESVGVYTVAVSLASVMALVSGAVGQAWSPHAVKAYEEDPQKAKLLYEKFLKVLVAVALFLIFLASVMGKEIIDMIFPKTYDNIFYPMLFLLVGSGFQITTQVTAVGISLVKKTIYFVYITFVVALVNILLNYLLIPIYAEKGASFATLVSYGLLTVTYALVSNRFFALRYDFKFIVYGFCALMLVVALTMLQYQYRYLILTTVLTLLFFKRAKMMEFVK